MFAPGPRAVGFTIVWPEGVIFRSMMTYHVRFLLLVLAGWVGCDRLPARGEPCAPSRASGQASQALGRRAAQARRQGPGFGPRGAGPDCVRCHMSLTQVLNENTYMDVKFVQKPLETPSFRQLSPPSRWLHTVDVPTLNAWVVPRQGWIAIGRAIDPVPQSEQAAVAVLREILGTRLNIAAREMRGLANHTIFVLPETASGAGLLHIRTGGRQESVAPLVKFSLEEVSRIHSPTDTVTDEEIERAKGVLVLGAWQKALDGARQASTTYAVETRATWRCRPIAKLARVGAGGDRRPSEGDGTEISGSRSDGHGGRGPDGEDSGGPPSAVAGRSRRPPLSRH